MTPLFIFPVIIRFLFFSSLSSLNNLISEDNRQTTSTVIWCGFIPFIWLFVFPKIVFDISTGINFELTDRKIKDKNEYPTRTIGLVAYFSVWLIILSAWVCTFLYYEIIYFVAPCFGFISLILFYVYWKKINKYKYLLIDENEKKFKDSEMNNNSYEIPDNERFKII